MFDPVDKKLHSYIWGELKKEKYLLSPHELVLLDYLISRCDSSVGAGIKFDTFGIVEVVGPVMLGGPKAITDTMIALLKKGRIVLYVDKNSPAPHDTSHVDIVWELNTKYLLEKSKLLRESHPDLTAYSLLHENLESLTSINGYKINGEEETLGVNMFKNNDGTQSNVILSNGVSSIIFDIEKLLVLQWIIDQSIDVAKRMTKDGNLYDWHSKAKALLNKLIKKVANSESLDEPIRLDSSSSEFSEKTFGEGRWRDKPGLLN